MSKFTNYGEAAVADFFRGQGIVLPDNFEIACLTAASDSAFTEAAWAGYARQSSVRSLAAWSATQAAGSTVASTGNSHQTSNNAIIDFGVVGAGGSATITHIGVFLDDSENELFCYAELDVPLSVSDGDPVSFAAGSIVFTLGLTGGLSDYLSNKMIDLIWRDQAFTMPANMYACLYTVAPTNAGGGTEVSVGGYTRIAVPTTDAKWDRTGGVLENIDAIIFPPPTANQGTVSHTAFRDAASSGNLLFWAALAVSKTMNAGGPAARFEPGERTIEVQ